MIVLQIYQVSAYLSPEMRYTCTNLTQPNLTYEEWKKIERTNFLLLLMNLPYGKLICPIVFFAQAVWLSNFFVRKSVVTSLRDLK